METNAEHYIDKIDDVSLCEIQLTIRGASYCDGECKQCMINTIKWLNEEYKPKLKACPFCGSTKSPTLVTQDELKDDGVFDCYTICCSATNGGCGAASGYALSKNEAIKKWNGRE